MIAIVLWNKSTLSTPTKRLLRIYLLLIHWACCLIPHAHHTHLRWGTWGQIYICIFFMVLVAAFASGLGRWRLVGDHLALLALLLLNLLWHLNLLGHHHSCGCLITDSHIFCPGHHWRCCLRRWPLKHTTLLQHFLRRLKSNEAILSCSKQSKRSG